jgi:transaldolase
MSANPLERLGDLGQSVWLDFITRDLLQSGELERLVAEDGLRGMTTNPTIFEQAIAGTTQYDAAIARDGGRSDAGTLAEALAVADVRDACDQFMSVYRDSEGRDGFVSLEVSPHAANDPGATVEEAGRLWSAVHRPNLMVKIPGTEPGLAAIQRCIELGINVNVTLLFGVARHAEVLDRYLSALETRLTRGQPVERLASVASFFVSRIDARIDPMLDQLATAEARSLRGTIAIANAARAYATLASVLASPRWVELARRGAEPQRLLWASTSTKDPAYPDVHYVEALIAPGTVNTMPPATLRAYRDHGRPEITLPHLVSRSEERLALLARLGISLDEVTTELELEGVGKFAASFDALREAVEQKASALAPA